MAVASELLGTLCSPQKQAPLVYFPEGVAGEEAFLLCPKEKCRYRIEEGVPVLLVEEAEALSKEELASLLQIAQDKGLS